MFIKEIQDKDQWENFILSQKEPPFLQSWNWGEFHKSLGDKIFRLGIFENEEIIGAALVIRVLARRGPFLFLPYGPIISQKSKACPREPLGVKSQNPKFKTFFDLKLDILKSLTGYLKDLAKEEKCCFIRISPFLSACNDFVINNVSELARPPATHALRAGNASQASACSRSDAGGENVKIFKDLKFRNAPIHLKPETTWLLDIRRSEEEILASMRKTTRNLIRRGIKENVQIIKTEQAEDLDDFYKIYQATAKRQDFIPFSKEYLKKEFGAFVKEKNISLFFAKHNNEFLAASLFIFYGKQGFYHHSASLHNNSKIPTSYLLLWEAIREAKKRGCEIFNFWGIAPDNKPKHPWQGLSLFKKGFGGYQKNLIHAQDLPINNFYWLNWAIETFRRIKRGY